MMVSLQQLSAKGRVRRLPTAHSEIAALLKVVERDLSDAQLPGLSPDRGFATAYNAALQLCTVALRAEGYRTHGVAHHHTTIAALPMIIGHDAAETADYLDACRSRRNTVDYDGVGVATEADVLELIKEVGALQVLVLRWLKSAHPDLV